MSNPTELPGLDRIEALRTALENVRDTSFGYDGDSGVKSIADEALSADDEAARRAQPEGDRDKLLRIIAYTYQIAGAHDCPEHILDVLSDPEAATDEQIESLLPYQPEGEAPQADAMMVSRKLLADCLKSMNHAVAYGETRQGRPPSQTCMFEIEALTALLAKPAATLSPLCGAQHAESGKESIRQHEAIEVAVDQCYPKQDSPHASVNDKIGAARLAFRKGYRAALAAQQAAAPGPAHETIVREGDNLVCAACGTSAPGTPEAPDENRKGIDLWRATLRACGELPEGYEVRIELENGCGMVAWYDERGERHVIDGEGYLSDDVNEAVDAAIERAAQLDGGQEGSGSNA